MQVHRLDEDFTVPFSDGASAYRIGPVTARAADVQVHVLHLAAGGSWRSASALQRRLVWVVRGEGQASGGDGRCRRLRAGQAASWDAGEEHSVESSGGLTAVLVEGLFEVLARSVLREIVVSDYDPAWPDRFETVRAFVWPAVEDVASRIDHVGSTSVPGLAAKPIVDLDIVVAAEDLVGAVVQRVERLGYRWLGDLGVAGRQAFWPEGGTPAAGLPVHHLYAVVEGNRAHLDHVLLRDLLRTDADARRRYADVKRDAASRADDYIDRYGQIKAPLVAELLTRARQERGLAAVEYWEPGADDA